jgi:hypothetical protein
MTTADDPGPEAALCQAFREQADRYRSALALADDLPAALRRGDDVSGRLAEVMALLDEVAAGEARLAPARGLWQRSGSAPGPELRALIADVTDLVDRLARTLGEAEQEVARRRQSLAPQLDALIRGRQMRRAYGDPLRPSLAPA